MRYDIQVPLGYPNPLMSVLDPGDKSGKCLLTGTIGNFFQEIIVDPWLQRGHK